jgi:hypothetical protein
MMMMNDTSRNQFYDQILREVTGKRCLEIGFGPGLLSFIALKYQPKHIVAVEQQQQVYELGKYLIKKLGVEDRITLLNEQIDSSFIDPAEFDIVYHEVIGIGLWDEGVFSHLDTSVPVIPSTYVCDFYACQISLDEFPNLYNYWEPTSDNDKFRNWYYDIKDPSWPDARELADFDLLPDHIKIECIKQFDFVKENFKYKNTEVKFIPGVDVDIDYVNEIQNLLTLENSRSDAAIINKSFIDEEKYLNRSKKVLSMEINQQSKKILVTDHNNITTTTNIDFTKNFIDLIIDRSALTGTSLIMPIFSLKHNESNLILSQSSQWGHSGNNAIVKQGIDDITVRQHFNANGIEYF